MMHHVGTAITRAPERTANKFLDTCCRRNNWQLGLSIVCGVVAVYVHSSNSLSEKLFGESVQESWQWWTMAVPIYVYLAVYFTRFLGSYLARTWLREISESPVTHKALVALTKGLVEETDFAEVVAAFLEKEEVVDGIAELTAAVLSSSSVHNAAAGATANVLLDHHVQKATVEAATTAMQDEKLQAGIEGLLGRQELTAPLAAQISRVLDDGQVRQAAAGLIHEVLEDDSVKEVVHLRALSLVGDSALLEAGRKGVCRAIFGRGQRGRGRGLDEHEVQEIVPEPTGPEDRV